MSAKPPESNVTTPRVIRDVPATQFKISELEPVPVLRPKDQVDDFGHFCSNEEMHKRAIALEANLGVADARLIFKHKDEIPNRFKPWGIEVRFIFPGSIMVDFEEVEYFVYLKWDGKGSRRWYLLRGDYHPANKWREDCYFIRCNAKLGHLFVL